MAVLLLALVLRADMASASPLPSARKALPMDWNIPPAYRDLVAAMRNNSSASDDGAGLTPNIIGGTVVPEGQLPWVTLITYYDSQFCSGMMIGRRLMLTAGHCTFYDEDNTAFRVYARRWRFIEGETNGARVFTVVRQMRHPRFEGKTFAHDLGIWELRPVTSGATVEVVRLNLDFPNQPPLNGALVTVSGWGVIDRYGTRTERLRQVQLPTVPISTCTTAMRLLDPATPVYPQGSICAGPRSGGMDSCSGDSGGPMFRNINGRIHVQALTSWGVGCAQANAFGVYQRVSDGDRGAWIKSVVARYPLADQGYIFENVKKTTKKIIRTTTRKVVKRKTTKKAVKTTKKATNTTTRR
jgi:trypsin